MQRGCLQEKWLFSRVMCTFDRGPHTLDDGRPSVQKPTRRKEAWGNYEDLRNSEETSTLGTQQTPCPAIVF